MVVAIADGHILRAGQFDPSIPSYCDSDEPRPPANLFQHQVVDAPPPEFSEFDGWVAYSVFWKEHPFCLGPRDIIRYLNINNLPQKPYHSVWEADCISALNPFSISINNRRTTYLFTIIHWPDGEDSLLQAHVHLLLPQEFSGDKKSHKKRRKAAITMLLKYLKCVLLLPIDLLGKDEIKS